MAKLREWVNLGDNYVLHNEEQQFHISYNPAPKFGSNGVDETALRKDGMFFILDGDWRNEYENHIHSLDECLEVFESHKDEHISSWSN